MAEDETNTPEAGGESAPEKDPNQEPAAPEPAAQSEGSDSAEVANGTDVPVQEPPPPNPPPTPEPPPAETPPRQPPPEVPKEEPSDPPSHKHSAQEAPLLSAKEMDDIEVAGEVVIHGGVFKLGELAGLKVGSMVEIDAAELTSSRFVVGGGLLAEGELVRPSKSADKIALKITKLIEKD